MAKDLEKVAVKSDNNDKVKIMESDNIGNAIWKFAIPAIITSIVAAVYNIVDTAFIGMLDDTLAMAAVSVIFPLIILINAIGQMIGVGAASYIARLLGAKQKKQADKVATTGIIISFIVGGIVTLFMLIFLEPVLKILGATEAVLPYALVYATPIAIGASLPIIMPTLGAIIRAEGSVKFASISIAISAVLNIILDPIFMFQLDMGVFGAALATVLSQCVSVIILMTYFIIKKSTLEFKISNFSLNKKIYSQIFNVGIATFLTQALISISTGLINVQAQVYGDELIASYGIVLKLSALILMIVFGYNQGFQPIASYNYGAKNYTKLKKAIKISVINITIFCTLSTIFFMVFASQAISLFTKDPLVIEFGTKALRTMIIMYPLVGVTILYGVLYQSMGKVKEALLVGCARQGIFFIPIISILPRILGINGIYYAQAVADIFSIVLVVILAIITSRELDEADKQLKN